MNKKQALSFTTLTSVLPDIAAAATISLCIWIIVTMVFYTVSSDTFFCHISNSHAAILTNTAVDIEKALLRQQ